MRITLAAVFVMVGLILVPSMALAGVAQPAESSNASRGPDSNVHATRGVVKSIDDATLVVARPKNRGEITFKLGPTLHRDGQIKAGATVSVRYRDEGKEHIATAVSLQKPHG